MTKPRMTPAQYAEFMASHAKQGKRVNQRKKFFAGERQESVPDNAFAIQIEIMEGKETDPNENLCNRNEATKTGANMETMRISRVEFDSLFE